ncbi:outer membrane protein assembly factor BamE [Thiocystis violacea]|uniref:outer membrane protein assembly factor BamE n=1 Tax=Thiocystis violacea TaxID=13725 RepID=UPI001F5B74FB|nr:outer membrane protein assembly factor BamE [Thiocystis violacea]
MISGLVVFAAVGCARDKKPDETQTSVLEGLPFVYRMTVQQGNILTEDMVKSLQLGMTKRQVNFVLGTPMLVDFFHADRWDYTYTIKRGHQPMDQRNLTLYFQDDLLTRIAGDVRPATQGVASPDPGVKEVRVPDYEPREGLITKGLKAVGAEPKD